MFHLIGKRKNTVDELTETVIKYIYAADVAEVVF